MQIVKELSLFFIFGKCFHDFFIGAFDDEDVTHVDGSVDPVRDLETILNELRLKVRFRYIYRIYRFNVQFIL